MGGVNEGAHRSMESTTWEVLCARGRQPQGSGRGESGGSAPGLQTDVLGLHGGGGS